MTTSTTRPASASWRSIVMTCRSSAGSRPEVGSSRISSDGPVSSSSATDARLRWPPESLSTRVLTCWVISSSSSTCATTWARSALVVSGGSRSSAAYISACWTVSWPCTTSSCGTIPIRDRSEAYSEWMLWPSNVTVPVVGWVYPATNRANVDLPAPDGPMTAVNVPGRAEIEMLSSSVLLPSMVQVTPCTSRPPVRVAASVSLRRARVPPLNTRSMLPIVTVSPSCRTADSTRAPLTKVPLMLRLSRISVPSGPGISVAWCRDASTSGTTMSLSVARPILTDPGGASAGRPGRRIFSMLVARLPSLVRGAAVGPIDVTDSRAGCDIGACRTGWG